MTKKEREMCFAWYKRGIRDGRQQVVEGIMRAMGLDYPHFTFDPISEIESEKAFGRYDLPAYKGKDS